MGRHKQFATAAERQQAYRLRLAQKREATAATLGAIPVQNKGHRPPSRPARIRALESAAEALRDEYQRWRDALPEGPLAEGAVVDKLDGTIEGLTTILELIQELDPPRGFGRD